MARVKTGVVRRRRHKKIIKSVKGQWGSRGTLFRRSNEAMIRSLFYAYRDRRQRKRQMRRLWIQRINAAARLNGLSYSRLIHGLKLANIEVNRKMMAMIANDDPQAFTSLVGLAKNAIPA